MIDAKQREPEMEGSKRAPGRSGAIQSLAEGGLSALVSEVDDGGGYDFVDVSSKQSSSHRSQHDKDDTLDHRDSGTPVRDKRKAIKDDFEGVDGEIDSENGYLPGHGKAQEPHDGRSQKLNSSPRSMLHGEEYPENVGEISEVQDDAQSASQGSRAVKVSSVSEPEIIGDNEMGEQGDTVVSGETSAAASRPLENAEDLSAWHPRLNLEIGAYYPQHLDLDDEISPYSLQEKIRKVREHQDVAQALEPTRLADTRLLAEVLASASASQSSSTDLDAAAASAVEEVERSATENAESSVEELPRGENNCRREKTGVGEAILLGALASGVNKPTWFAFKAVLVALVASLVLLLHAAWQSDNRVLLMNVIFLLAIAGTLIILLSWYVSMIGLVPVEKQMAELNLTAESSKVESKTL